jgi:hypothetical protein
VVPLLEYAEEDLETMHRDSFNMLEPKVPRSSVEGTPARLSIAHGLSSPDPSSTPNWSICNAAVTVKTVLRYRFRLHGFTITY